MAPTNFQGKIWVLAQMIKSLDNRMEYYGLIPAFFSFFLKSLGSTIIYIKKIKYKRKIKANAILILILKKGLKVFENTAPMNTN